MDVSCSLHSLSKHCDRDDMDCCGLKGGDPAVPGRYPYMVSLQKFPRIHFCGGILVKKNVVLTAAHCVHPDTRNSELFPSVSIGGVDVKGDADTEVRCCQGQHTL